MFKSLVLMLAVVGSAQASVDEAGSQSLHARTRQTAQQVLAEPEFADIQRNRQPPWWARWAVRATRAVQAFFESLPSWLLWVIFLWLVLALLAIVAHLIYVVLQSTGTVGPRSTARRPTHEGELLGIRDLEFNSVYKRAQQLLACGDWAAAVRHLYVAAILWLDQSGRVTFRISKTNRDYLRELGNYPEAGEPFTSLTALFERAVYRGEQPDAQLCRTMQRLLERIQHGDAATESR